MKITAPCGTHCGTVVMGQLLPTRKGHFTSTNVNATATDWDLLVTANLEQDSLLACGCQACSHHPNRKQSTVEFMLLDI